MDRTEPPLIRMRRPGWPIHSGTALPSFVWADAVEPAPHVASPNGQVDPARWQRRIWALIELGDYAQAQRELKAFRETYPDYPADDLERRLGATPE